MKFIEDITDFIFVEHQPEKADVIFIPGGDQGALAVTAAKLYREGYAPWVLPSGRFSKPVGRCMIPGYETEWEFLRDILVEHGVPKEAVLEELAFGVTYGEILRAMGMVPGETSGEWYYFDLVPEEYEIRTGAPDYTGKLCVIGSGLKTEELENAFEAM